MVNLEDEDTLAEQHALDNLYTFSGAFSHVSLLDTTGEMANNYEITAIPTSFFLDREGAIRVVNIGPMTKRAIEAERPKL